MIVVLVLTSILYCFGFKDVYAVENQDVYTYFYEEIGCKRIGQKPIYDCPDFTPKNGTCRLLNKMYNSGEKVDQSLLKGSCLPFCECDPKGTIYCAGTDCALRDEKGCYPKYSLDSCCPADELICGDSVAECTVEGQVYKEGARIYPKNSCLACVCDKGFKLEAPFCRPRTCFLEAKRPYDLINYNAPVYFKEDSCCPSTFMKDDGKPLIKKNSDASKLSGPHCRYGEHKFAIGEAFEKVLDFYGTKKNLQCSCTAPPFLICLETA